MMRPLWASCITLWASCIIFQSTSLAEGFEPLTRAEPVVRMVLQESNNEPFYGMVTVAGTAFDRRDDPRWPSTLKGVVYQPWQYTGMRFRLRQYAIVDIELARTAVRLAKEGIRPCGRVLWYHTQAVAPKWSKTKHLVCTIGNHIFYSDKKGR